MPETREYTVYKFEELGEQARTRAIEKWRNLNNENGDFSSYAENITDIYKQELEAIGFEVGDIEWSGFCSQGDGARIEIKDLDFRKWLPSLSEEDKIKFHLLPLIYDANLIYSIGTVKNSYANHYSHSRTQTFEINEDFGDSRFPTLSEITSAAQDYLDNFIREKSDGLYADLERAYDDVNSDTWITEEIKANEDRRFMADGELD